MAVSDQDFRQCGDLITPLGGWLQVMPDPGRKQLKDGIYVISKAKNRKWILSIYRNVQNKANDLEIAIDVKALVHQDMDEYRRALIWLSSVKAQLQHEESRPHIVNKCIEAFEMGFKTANAHSFLKRLEIQLNQASPSERWSIKSDAVAQATQPSTPLAEKQALPHASKKEDVVSSMVRTAYAAQNQSGRETVTVAKTKEVRFASENEFRAHVAELMASGRCAITGLILDESMQDPELMPSLDRIDSNRHYEPGNLQVVARFVNRWKSDDSATNFARLLKLIRSSSSRP